MLLRFASQVAWTVGVCETRSGMLMPMTCALEGGAVVEVGEDRVGFGGAVDADAVVVVVVVGLLAVPGGVSVAGTVLVEDGEAFAVGFVVLLVEGEVPLRSLVFDPVAADRGGTDEVEFGDAPVNRADDARPGDVDGVGAPPARDEDASHAIGAMATTAMIRKDRFFCIQRPDPEVDFRIGWICPPRGCDADLMVGARHGSGQQGAMLVVSNAFPIVPLTFGGVV
jgi:hypothetical protein